MGHFGNFSKVQNGCLRILRVSLHKKLLVFHRTFSYSEKESESNDVMMQFEEFSNVHNSDRASNTTRSNLGYKIV